MTDSATTTEFRATRSYVAAEIHGLRIGFAALRGMLHDLRDTEGDIPPGALDRILWVADHVKAELDEAVDHAESLAGDERAEVAARRSSPVLQAAE